MANIHNYLHARRFGDCDTLRFPGAEQTPPRPAAEPNASIDKSIEATLAAVEDLSWKLEDLAREFKCCGYFDDDDDDDRPRAA